MCWVSSRGFDSKWPLRLCYPKPSMALRTFLQWAVQRWVDSIVRGAEPGSSYLVGEAFAENLWQPGQSNQFLFLSSPESRDQELPFHSLAVDWAESLTLAPQFLWNIGIDCRDGTGKNSSWSLHRWKSGKLSLCKIQKSAGIGSAHLIVGFRKTSKASREVLSTKCYAVPCSLLLPADNVIRVSGTVVFLLIFKWNSQSVTTESVNSSSWFPWSRRTPASLDLWRVDVDSIR